MLKKILTQIIIWRTHICTYTLLRDGNIIDYIYRYNNIIYILIRRTVYSYIIVFLVKQSSGHNKLSL